MIFYKFMWIFTHFSKISVNDILRLTVIVDKLFPHKGLLKKKKSLWSVGTSPDCRLWPSPFSSVVGASTRIPSAGGVYPVQGEQTQINQEETPQKDHEEPDVCPFPGPWAKLLSPPFPKLRSLPEWSTSLEAKWRNSERLFSYKCLTSHMDTI